MSMTSALNRRPPLNGNKVIAILLLAATLLACRATRTDVVVAPVVLPGKPGVPAETETTTPEKPAEPVVVAPEVEEKEEESPALPARKYTIALLLPLGLNNYEAYYGDTAAVGFKRHTEIALEFYQGFGFALETMRQTAVQAEVFLFDTRNDANTVRRLLNGPDFPDADLLVGPVFNDNLRVAAEFCKKKKIPLISPLSSSPDITEENPYYYSANATELSHLEALLTFVHDRHPGKGLYILHQETERELEKLKAFDALNQSLFPRSPVKTTRIKLSTGGSSADLRTALDSTRNQLVFIPSYDEVYSNYALNQLAQLKASHQITVFGMPNWTDFRSANYDYYEWLGLHLTQSYWLDETAGEVARLQSEMEQRYGLPPTPYTWQGYDLAHYVIAHLASLPLKPRHKEQFFTADDLYNGVQTGFLFRPLMTPDGQSVDFWDNKYLHILKFEHYAFRKVD